jgi:hypothetical protein
MHRESRGAKEALREGDLIVWTSEEPEGSRYAAVFNIGENPLPLNLILERIGLTGAASGTELWSGAPAELASDVLQATVPPHGVRLYRFFYS